MATPFPFVGYDPTFTDTGLNPFPQTTSNPLINALPEFSQEAVTKPETPAIPTPPPFTPPEVLGSGDAMQRMASIVGSYGGGGNRLATALAAAGQGAMSADPFSGRLGALSGAATAAASALSALKQKEDTDGTVKPKTVTKYYFQRKDEEGKAVGEPVEVPKERANMSIDYLPNADKTNLVAVSEPTPLSPDDLLGDGDRSRWQGKMKEIDQRVATLDSAVSDFNNVDIDALQLRGLGVGTEVYDAYVSSPLAVLFPEVAEHRENLELLDKATINGILDAAAKLSGPKSDKDIELLTRAEANAGQSKKNLAYFRAVANAVLTTSTRRAAAMRDLYSRRYEFASKSDFEKAVAKLDAPTFGRGDLARVENVDAEGLISTDQIKADKEITKLAKYLTDNADKLHDDDYLFFEGGREAMLVSKAKEYIASGFRK